MNPITVLQQMAILFLMIAVGFLANRRGIMNKEAEAVSSRLIVNITNPALIISSVATSKRLESDSMVLVVFAAAAAYYLVLPWAAKGLTKILRPGAEERSQFEAMLMFANIGFMGIPVAEAVLGRESVLYISIFVAIFNVAFFSYGVLLLGGGEQKFKLSSLRKVVNPGTIAACFAVTMYLCKWKLPELILSPITTIGHITTPLAMLIIGSSLARNPMGQMLREKNLYKYAAARLFIIPIAMMLVGKSLLSDPMLYQVMVLISAMPAASIVVMTRNDMGLNSDFAAKAIAFSTFFCVFTIPIVAMIMGIFA